MITKEESNYIKLIAMSAMLLDHIGAHLFPWNILRVIGRISFPIFAYQLGIGYSMTSNRKNYFTRLLGFGVLSQIPFALLNNRFTLNILFTLALGVAAIWLLEKKKTRLFIAIAPLSFFVDYGIYGLAIILILYFFKSELKRWSFFTVATLLYSSFYLFWAQIYSLLSLVFVSAPKPRINLPQNLFYIFYPAHLAAIFLIKTLFLS